MSGRKPTLLWHYVAEGARIHPSRPAVVCRDEQLTYGALDDMSTRVARYLMSNGVGPGDRIALCMPKSPRCIAVMVGILKAGAAYVPIDSSAPARRVSSIMRQCGVEGLFANTRKLRLLGNVLEPTSSLEFVVSTDEGTGDLAVPRLGKASIVHWDDATPQGVDEIRFPVVERDDPAYVLYTSGSTGEPKGVVLSHANAMSFVEWASDTFAVDAEDRIANHAPLYFDLSVFDIYAALEAGACVVMVPEEVAPFPVQLADWIVEQEISVWYSVPSALTRLLLNGELERLDFTKLRLVLFAGEVFPVKYLRRVMKQFDHARFFNLYGPTETNVCTYYPLPETLGDDVEEIPIGKACEPSEVFAVIEGNLVADPGQTGELYVRGPTVMSGYWGLPTQTSQVLIPDPRRPDDPEMVYRTGDIVRTDADGSYWFVGRGDLIVKTRGYRVGLGEIEQVLNSHEQVQEAVALAVPDDEIGTRLVAAVVLDANAAVAPDELARFCLAVLPRYMVPEEFVTIEKIPYTPTGKADRDALFELLVTKEDV